MSNLQSEPISRRTLAAGAAWATPAVLAVSAAPAFAVSPCTPTTVFDTLVVGSQPSTISFSPSGVTASLTYTSSGQGGDNTPGSTGRVARTSGASAWNYIELEMLNPDSGDYVELTITLSEPVEGLSFVLHDIDSESQGFVDSVIVGTPGYTHQRGGNIQGAGSNGDPFRPINWGDTPIESGLGDVRLTWPGQVQTVTIRYRARLSGNSTNQHIGLGDISYDACIISSRRQARAAERSKVSVSQRTPEFVESDGTVDH